MPFEVNERQSEPETADADIKPSCGRGDAKSVGIFVYGTLMAPKLLVWVLTGDSRETAHIQREPATLHGHTRVRVRHSDYPALIEDRSSCTEGYLIIPKSVSEWKKLDDFEGEIYKRKTRTVYLSSQANEVLADVYVWDSDPELLEMEEWDYEYFEKNRLEDWLDLFDGMEMVG